MKLTCRTIFLAAILACVPIAATVTLTGCGTTSQPTVKAVAFQTLKSTQIAVDRAMKVYGTAVANGKVNATKQQQIDDLHTSYRSAFRVAATAARNDLTAITPDAVAQIATQILTLTSNL